MSGGFLLSASRPPAPIGMTISKVMTLWDNLRIGKYVITFAVIFQSDPFCVIGQSTKDSEVRFQENGFALLIKWIHYKVT